MSPATFVTVLLPLAAVLVAASREATPPPVTPLTPEELKKAAAEVVNDIRTVAEQAKQGMYLEAMHQNVLHLRTAVFDIIDRLGYEVSECDTKSVMKMAAAGTGSHEVLTVMFAKDELEVLNGRLSLSLAFLKHVAEQLEDELTLSSDVGHYFVAIAFGADTTLDIIQTADKTVKAKDMTESHGAHRVRRQSLNLGSGWSLGFGGVTWQNTGGNVKFNVKPKFSLNPLKFKGVKATITIKF